MRTRHAPHIAALLCSVAISLWANEAMADPDYGVVALIPVPPILATNPTGAFSFDISYFDGNTQLDYVSDRNNASIDVFSAANNSFVQHITGTGANAFVGTTPSPDTGPNGVIVANGVVYGGDGDASVKAFQLSPGNPPAVGSPINVSNGGGAAQGRADEMGFDPGDHILAVASDHGTPSPYISLIDTTTNTVMKTIVFDGSNGTPNATGGIEQTVWNGNTKLFYSNVPQIGVNPSDPGGIAVYNSSGVMQKVYDFASFGISSCGPTGLAVGPNNTLIVGCGSTQSFTFDPTANGGAGKIIATFAGVTADELSFDPTTDLAFFASSSTGLAIVNALTGQFLQDLTTAAGSHSVSVDPVSGEAFVPVRSGNLPDPECVTGCIEVFAPVPETSTLPLFAGGLFGLAALVWRRKRKLSTSLHLG